MTSTKLHELIDREDPKCLYCNSDFDIELSGDYIGGSSSMLNVDILSCRNCHEQFEITSIDEADNVIAFAFTCKGIVIRNVYHLQSFILGGKELLYGIISSSYPENPNYIPEFNIDFSDKNKLYEKLKTYLIFS
jgi:hypothetical protein